MNPFLSQPARSWGLGARIAESPISRPITNNQWGVGRVAWMGTRSPVYPFTWAAFRLPSAPTYYPWTAPSGWIKGSRNEFDG